jgi:hypothetical protein
MTTQIDEKAAEKEAAKAAREARSEANAAEEKSLNAGRTGKGTRISVGMSRGKNPQKVVYESFDESQPDTLPKTLSEFMDLSKTQDEAVIVSYLIDGFNSAMYSNASDPVAEYVDASWPADLQTRFKTIIRNYSRDAGVSIEDAVSLIKPGVVAAAQKAASVPA